jgi:hypothetical protein
LSPPIAKTVIPTVEKNSKKEEEKNDTIISFESSPGNSTERDPNMLGIEEKKKREGERS